MLIWNYSRAMITKPWPMCPIIQLNWTYFTRLFISGRNYGDSLIAHGVADRFTHLIEHPVSETQQLPKQVQPAVEERKEGQQEYHYTWWGKRERRKSETHWQWERLNKRGSQRGGREREEEWYAYRERERERVIQSETQIAKGHRKHGLGIAMLRLTPPHIIDSNDRLQCISQAWQVKVYSTVTGRLILCTWKWWIEQG